MVVASRSDEEQTLVVDSDVPAHLSVKQLAERTFVEESAAMPGPFPGTASTRKNHWIAAGGLLVAVVVAVLWSLWPAEEEAPAPLMGQLVVNAIPWGRVSAFIGEDGESYDQWVGSYTPLSVTLPPGSYKIQLKNDNFEGPQSVDVEVQVNETARRLCRFTEVSTDAFFNKMGW